MLDNVGQGGDTVTIHGRTRSLIGYLGDFLFSPERVQAPIQALSGGERNRLLLARLFARPANLLVLDEPTNDLDIDTLEILEAMLLDFPGTLILVSHDRALLDNLVTSTLILSGDGRVVESIGGYTDWRKSQSQVESARQPAHQLEKTAAPRNGSRVSRAAQAQLPGTARIGAAPWSDRSAGSRTGDAQRAYELTRPSTRAIIPKSAGRLNA